MSFRYKEVLSLWIVTVVYDFSDEAVFGQPIYKENQRITPQLTANNCKWSRSKIDDVDITEEPFP